ncbi:MAG: preprotein translocase subunit SecE [Gammaproteobacteria bacterium]|nr:preprotein translocase subunit SecE [Gammaproteobacteria bacterium]
MDRLKLALAAAIVATAIGGFYIFAEQSLLLRVVALLALTGVAMAIAVRTEVGRNAWNFSRGALIEIRKVVWPTRQETVQTTLMVMAAVLVLGIILWIFDMFLAWGITLLTGQGA